MPAALLARADREPVLRVRYHFGWLHTSCDRWLLPCRKSFPRASPSRGAEPLRWVALVLRCLSGSCFSAGRLRAGAQPPVPCSGLSHRLLSGQRKASDCVATRWAAASGLLAECSDRPLDLRSCGCLSWVSLRQELPEPAGASSLAAESHHRQGVEKFLFAAR